MDLSGHLSQAEPSALRGLVCLPLYSTRMTVPQSALWVPELDDYQQAGLVRSAKEGALGFLYQLLTHSCRTSPCTRGPGELDQDGAEQQLSRGSGVDC